MSVVNFIGPAEFRYSMLSLDGPLDSWMVVVYICVYFVCACFCCVFFCQVFFLCLVWSGLFECLVGSPNVIFFSYKISFFSYMHNPCVEQGADNNYIVYFLTLLHNFQSINIRRSHSIFIRSYVLPISYQFPTTASENEKQSLINTMTIEQQHIL